MVCSAAWPVAFRSGWEGREEAIVFPCHPRAWEGVDWSYVAQLLSGMLDEKPLF